MEPIPGDSHTYMRNYCELREPLLGSQHSGGHPARSTRGRIQWKLRITTPGTFLSTGLGAFWHPFWYWEQHPSPHPKGRNLLLRSGNSFVAVTIKTGWPGSHFNPVWWPCISQLCSIRQKVRFKAQKASCCPSFWGLCYPLTIYRNKGKFSQRGWPVWRKECAGSPRVPGAPGASTLLSGQPLLRPPHPCPWLQHWTLIHCKISAELGNVTQKPIWEQKRWINNSQKRKNKWLPNTWKGIQPH